MSVIDSHECIVHVQAGVITELAMIDSNALLENRFYTIDEIVLTETDQLLTKIKRKEELGSDGRYLSLLF